MLNYWLTCRRTLGRICSNFIILSVLWTFFNWLTLFFLTDLTTFSDVHFRGKRAGSCAIFRRRRPSHPPDGEYQEVGVHQADPHSEAVHSSCDVETRHDELRSNWIRKNRRIPCSVSLRLIIGLLKSSGIIRGFVLSFWCGTILIFWIFCVFKDHPHSARGWCHPGIQPMPESASRYHRSHSRTCHPDQRKISCFFICLKTYEFKIIISGCKYWC